MCKENKISVKTLWICFLLHIFDVGAVTNFTSFYVENHFDDKLCLQYADQITGVSSFLTGCARGCLQTDGCVSFFYSGTELECYSVNIVLWSESGCYTRSGARYYIRQGYSDCYTYTIEDQKLSLSEEGLCESYQFHNYTAGNNQAFPGCNDCNCCQLKGCYSGSSHYYNGTWSQTRHGRKCQRWDSQSPHEHNRDSPSGFPLDASVFDAHNYCRNPGFEDAPWCYTEDPSVRWGFCDIPKC